MVDRISLLQGDASMRAARMLIDEAQLRAREILGPTASDADVHALVMPMLLSAAGMELGGCSSGVNHLATGLDMATMHLRQHAIVEFERLEQEELFGGRRNRDQLG